VKVENPAGVLFGVKIYQILKFKKLYIESELTHALMYSIYIIGSCWLEKWDGLTGILQKPL